MINKASNDLISREDVVTIIEAMIFESGKNLVKVYLLQDAKERIGRLKTAYNKEEVIEELKSFIKFCGENAMLILAWNH